MNSTQTTTDGKFIPVTDKNGNPRMAFKGGPKWKQLHNTLGVRKQAKITVTARPDTTHAKFINADILPIDSYESYLAGKELARFEFANVLLNSLVRRGRKYKNFG